MGFDKILYWLKCNYQKIILLNLKIFLYVWLSTFFLSQKQYNYPKLISKA